MVVRELLSGKREGGCSKAADSSTVSTKHLDSSDSLALLLDSSSFFLPGHLVFIFPGLSYSNLPLWHPLFLFHPPFPKSTKAFLENSVALHFVAKKSNDLYRSRRAHAVRARNDLVLQRRVCDSVEQNDVCGKGQVEAGAAVFLEQQH